MQKRAGTGRKSLSNGGTFVLKLLGIGEPGPALPILYKRKNKTDFTISKFLSNKNT